MAREKLATSPGIPRRENPLFQQLGAPVPLELSLCGFRVKTLAGFEFMMKSAKNSPVSLRSLLHLDGYSSMLFPPRHPRLLCQTRTHQRDNT
jgi:hypothetical protein